MTIATLGDLLSQVAAHLNRANLTAQIPLFVQLAEARIYYGSEEQPFPSQPLRVAAMEQSAYATIASQYVELPCDYLAHRRLYLDGSPVKELKFYTPQDFWKKWDATITGCPKAFTIEGVNMAIGPVPDGTYTGRLLYYRKFPALAASTDTNWILTNTPGIYLWGALLEAYRFIRNSDEAQKALNTFSGLVNGANTANKTDSYASAWQASPDIYTP
jgi:hypothetical protein